MPSHKAYRAAEDKRPYRKTLASDQLLLLTIQDLYNDREGLTRLCYWILLYFSGLSRYERKRKRGKNGPQARSLRSIRR
jgi:hypothetical protein